MVAGERRGRKETKDDDIRGRLVFFYKKNRRCKSNKEFAKLKMPSFETGFISSIGVALAQS